MSKKARHRHIFEKAKQAVIAAISCYNQPNFFYREESFCILMVNAWELLLKAKIVKDNRENIKSIYVVDKDAKRMDGKAYVKPKYKRNKAGNYMTIGFSSILKQSTLPLGKVLVGQLETLYEVRNASIHLAENGLKRTALEVFTATLKSFQLLCEQWFEEQVTDDLMLIPLAFDIPTAFSSEVSNKEAQNLLKFISEQEKSLNDNSEHGIRISVAVKFERSKEGLPVNLGRDGLPIVVDSEEQFKNKYPWTHQDNLVPRLQEDYQDFKINKNFFSLMKELKKDKNLCGERYLDLNKKRGNKFFYSPNIIPVIAKKLGLSERKQ